MSQTTISMGNGITVEWQQDAGWMVVDNTTGCVKHVETEEQALAIGSVWATDEPCLVNE